MSAIQKLAINSLPDGVRYVTPYFAPYEVNPDGQRILVAFPLTSESEPLVLVSDCTAELKK